MKLVNLKNYKGRNINLFSVFSRNFSSKIKKSSKRYPEDNEFQEPETLKEVLLKKFIKTTSQIYVYTQYLNISRHIRFFRRIEINKWVDDYICELQNELKKNNNELNLTLSLRIFQLIQEVEDYYYYQDKENIELDQKRRKLVGKSNKDEYEKVLNSTIKIKEKCYNRATDLIESRLNINVKLVQMFLFQSRFQTKSQYMFDAKKPYIDIPKDLLDHSNKDKVKYAFIYYAKGLKKIDLISSKFDNLAANDNASKDKIIKQFSTERHLLIDEIVKNYGIDPKYLTQLVKAHRLINNYEIMQFTSELKTFF